MYRWSLWTVPRKKEKRKTTQDYRTTQDFKITRLRKITKLRKQQKAITPIRIVCRLTLYT